MKEEHFPNYAIGHDKNKLLFYFVFDIFLKDLNQLVVPLKFF